MGWAPGARVTDADRAGDVKSLRRRLEDRLVLLVKGQGEWMRFLSNRVHAQLYVSGGGTPYF